MTRSSTNELFTPYKEPEREFRSSRRHFKTLSLDELRSLDFNLLSDEEYLEEEEEEEMAETMEQYMSKTRTDYGSGVARPKIDNKDKFELKGQFLKEGGASGGILDSRGRSNETSDGLAAIQAQLNNLGRELKKLNNKNMLLKLDNEQCKGTPLHQENLPTKEEGKSPRRTYYTHNRREDSEASKAQLRQTQETKSSRFQPPLKLIQTRYTVLDLTNTPSNEPYELRRNQVDDLMPTIEEGEVIEKFRVRNEVLDTGIDDYPNYFLENMDANRDEGMGDVIFGEPFLREADIKAKRFEGMITLYKGNNDVTYQMVRSHSRYKHLTNEQCNKIPPLLKVSEDDKRNGISHSYQKLKGFYKGVLNLGPNYIRDTKMEEWLTGGHISEHELE
ncbi:hypothetical protein Tco_1094208 [Tanacetum coccineum]|uniref:Uncharacterized protein n=1 Tax=Tanacetum coccineum TaxID=301880 RepID=A0ABQ5IEW7_9ASTR